MARVQNTIEILSGGQDLGKSGCNKSGTKSNKQHDSKDDGRIDSWKQRGLIFLLPIFHRLK